MGCELETSEAEIAEVLPFYFNIDVYNLHSCINLRFSVKLLSLLRNDVEGVGGFFVFNK